MEGLCLGLPFFIFRDLSEIRIGWEEERKTKVRRIHGFLLWRRKQRFRSGDNLKRSSSSVPTPPFGFVLLFQIQKANLDCSDYKKWYPLASKTIASKP
ncbi:hypothetical protein Lal_00023527 [Lupinus albus]|nr:hypothetical protein Lal_00023527 [Lupinus albus]